MVPFVVLLLAPMLMKHVVIGKNHEDFGKKNRRALLVFFLLLTVLVALRHESIGNDTQNYIRYFERHSNTEWNHLATTSSEVGFSYFNKLVSVVTREPQVFLAITSIVTIVMIYPTYKRLCIDPSLTIVLFCTMSTFVMLFSGIRQMLAIGIGFIAYEFTRNKKLIPFILCVLVAITFHTSAFMLIFMYPIYHAKITKKWLFFVIPILGFVFVFNKPIFSLLTMILNRYTRFEAEVSSTGAFTMLLLFALFALFAFLVPDDANLDRETIGLRNFLLLSLVLQMFAPLNMLAMRMNYYYIIFIPLLLPKIIACKSERWSQVAVIARHVMVVFFLAYFFINAAGGVSLHVFPYHFFWENVQ